ncbi:GTPase HflX, partial [bacterium]|nr:GTPase HflX [bacterium]
IGMKGLGETQLEIDRRMVKKRIQRIDKELKELEKRKSIEHQGREGLYNVSIVGYTNAGKSTLMNLLSGSDVFAENRLFATLDATTRKVEIDHSKTFLLTDTVGFINKLPHHLVASFHATLDEINYADLLLIVVDISHPLYEKHLKIVYETLDEIKCSNENVIVLFNKADLLTDQNSILKLTGKASLDTKEILEQLLKRTYGHNSLVISAKTGYGIDELKNFISEFMNKKNIVFTARVSAGNGKAVSYIKSHTKILEEEFQEDFFVCKLQAAEHVIVDLKKLGCEVNLDA